MAHVTGPISTLPGAVHPVPARQCCDKHADRPAVKRIQGETDSMGSELIDMCAECYAGYVEYQTSPEAADARCGTCEWCKNPATDLRHRRDFEEGMSGRVYMVCGACVERETKALMAEIDADDHDSKFGYHDDEVFIDDDFDPRYEAMLAEMEADDAANTLSDVDPELLATDDDIAEYRASRPIRRPIPR